MKRFFTVTVTIIVLFAGCVRKEAPALSTYVFEVPRLPRIAHSRYRDKVLKVSFPQAFRESIGEKIYYSYNDEERNAYLYARWATHAGKMLQGVMLEMLQQSGAFRAVLPYNSTAGADLRIESVVYDISHHIRNGRSIAVMSIEVSLIETYTNRLLKTRRFSYEEPTETVDAKGYVEATNRILRRFGRDLLRFLLRS